MIPSKSTFLYQDPLPSDCSHTWSRALTLSIFNSAVTIFTVSIFVYYWLNATITFQAVSYGSMACFTESLLNKVHNPRSSIIIWLWHVTMFTCWQFDDVCLFAALALVEKSELGDQARNNPVQVVRAICRVVSQFSPFPLHSLTSFCLCQSVRWFAVGNNETQSACAEPTNKGVN